MLSDKKFQKLRRGTKGLLITRGTISVLHAPRETRGQQRHSSHRQLSSLAERQCEGAGNIYWSHTGSQTLQREGARAEDLGHRPPLPISVPHPSPRYKAFTSSLRANPWTYPQPSLPSPYQPLSAFLRPPHSSWRHRAPSRVHRSRPVSTSPTRPSPRRAAAEARSTCVAELALLLLLLAIETALGGGGGGGSGGGSGCPIDTSHPARGKGEPELRCAVLRRRFSHVLVGALDDDADTQRGRGAREEGGAQPGQRKPGLLRDDAVPPALGPRASKPAPLWLENGRAEQLREAGQNLLGPRARGPEEDELALSPEQECLLLRSWVPRWPHQPPAAEAAPDRVPPELTLQVTGYCLFRLKEEVGREGGLVPTTLTARQVSCLPAASVSQLTDMNEQEEILLEQFLTLPQLKKIITDKDDLVKSIEELARKNLLLEPSLEAKRQTVLDKYELLTQMKSAFEKKMQRQHELSESCSASALQARLKVAAHEAEEESDNIAEDFLEGKTEIDDFLSSFMEKRTICHCRRAKEEKLQQAIAMHSQFHAPL
ncbi:PREDICTED: vacuolar protein sorting-associated protein 37A [Propithecus coquereli]|uniref:vacuolar protein sorting-associated protein 37A n=1 Tax=Propithecus coquereli TaxID=379532 RepID=UPI00063F4BEF|nr:PREDICTED: vacuolar protein sorting-associated protein 37A [Propithecus coquereli]